MTSIQNNTMEDLICKGTPAEIADAITAQRARLGFFVEPLTLGPALYVVQHSLDEGPHLGHLRIPFALIGPAPDGQAQLTSRAEGDPKSTQWWELLVSELGRVGWLATTLETAHAERAADAPKKRGPVGRRRDPDNEWAYQQVNEMGRTPAEVYPEWAQRRRGHKTLKQLDDPLDSFKHAIATRKK